MNTREKGSRGEERAIDYLLQNGYTIVTRNYQSRKGEIDCIAQDEEGTFVFIEVKSAQSSGGGHPFYWVNRGKQRKIAALAKRYLYEHGLYGKPCRFDVIAVTNSTIDHLKNAFLV